MKNDIGLAVALFAAIMAAAVALAIANDITGPACAAARGTIAGKDFDFGCLEFWINRYQSLIGSILTAAVAGVTLIWVKRQLVPASQQADIAAAKTFKEDVLPELVAQYQRLQNIKKNILTANFQEIPVDQPISKLSIEIDKLVDRRWGIAVDTLDLFLEIGPESQIPEIRHAHLAVGSLVNQLAALCGELHILLSDESAPDREEEPDLFHARLLEIVGSSRSLMSSLRDIVSRSTGWITSEILAAGEAMRARRQQALGSWAQTG